MAQHTNYNKKTKEQIEDETKQLIARKYAGVITDEAKKDIARLQRGEPLDYVVGWADFCGAKIDLSFHPLIPRPITENWVTAAIAEIKNDGKAGAIRCLDIFAGSGCVGIAVLKNIPEAHVDFVDVDPRMIEQIQKNARSNGIPPDRYSIVRSDIFGKIGGTYDYIFSNPPYIPESDAVKRSALEHEPHHAFLAGRDGMRYIRPFLEKAVLHVRPGGKLWMEYFNTERDAVSTLVNAYPRCTFSVMELGSDCECLVVRMRSARHEDADPFFDFFDNERPHIDPDAPSWRPFWFKEYVRSQKLILPKPPLPNIPLQEALSRRITTREFSGAPLSLQRLGALLYWSAGLIHGMPDADQAGRRPYPSGGARFPVEIYVSSGAIENIQGGVFHYNVREHALERIRGADPKKIQDAHDYDFAKKAPAFILLSLLKERTMEKYGSLGYKLGILEAGHIAQNIYLTASLLDIGTLALGGMDYAAAEHEIGLGAEEPLFYQIALGMLKK